MSKIHHSIKLWNLLGKKNSIQKPHFKEVLNKANLLDIFPKIGVHHLTLNLLLSTLKKLKP